MSWDEYEDVRVALSELHRSGELNPASLGPALRPALKSGRWRHWVHPVTGVRHFDDFDAFVEHETRLNVDAIVVTLRRDSRCADVVRMIEQARRDQVPAAAKEHVGKGHPSLSFGNTKANEDDYVIARLKRDDPELAIEVIHGNISPHAAAIKAGIRRPRSTFVTDSIDGAMAALLRHFSYEDILAALKRVQP